MYWVLFEAVQRGFPHRRFDRTLSVVLKSLSQEFYRTFLGPRRGFDRTLLEGSIEPFWGDRRFQGTVLKFPLVVKKFTRGCLT